VTVLPGAWLGCDLDPDSTVEVMGVVSKAAQGCPLWRTSWKSLIQKDNPDVVMLVLGRWEVLNRIYDGTWTHIGEPAWDAHLNSELDQAIDILSSQGATVVVTTLPYIQGDSEQPDGQPWDMNQPPRTDAYNAVVRAAVAQRPKTSRVLDLNALIDPDGHYTSYIDGSVTATTNTSRRWAANTCAHSSSPSWSPSARPTPGPVSPSPADVRHRIARSPHTWVRN
jgi:hypothetical protein